MDQQETDHNHSCNGEPERIQTNLTLGKEFEKFDRVLAYIIFSYRITKDILYLLNKEGRKKNNSHLKIIMLQDKERKEVSCSLLFPNFV